ncbi:MAG: condensation domain-containing protein, partial [Candidatus Sericytochromatia bacterium]
VKNCAEVIEKQLQQENYVYELPVITLDQDNKFEPFNLTEIQQAYLIGRNSKFENSQVSSHAYLEIESENLDITRLEKAVNKVIQRHEMLRTVIYDNTSSVSNSSNYSTYYQQTIKQVDYYKIKVFDLRDKDIDLEKKNLREKYSHELLDYTKAPIFNIFVSISSDIHKCIHISIDAIIADATSMVLLAKEIAYYYDNLDQDLESLNITFRDYLITENSIKDSWLYKKSEAYWKNRVQTIPSAPQLPMSDNRLNNPKFNRLQSRLDSDTWSKLKSKAEKIGVTPTIVLLSSFSKILSLWSKNRHFTLNLTLFNRLPLHNHVSKLIGDFTSLNLLEINYEKYKNFSDACKQIQSQLWEDIDNRAFSGVSVVRELTKERGLENALMPIVFTSMLGESFPEKILGGKLAYSITQTPQVWLDHQVAEIDNELSFNWDYPENLYPKNMLEDMFETYKSLLNNLAQDDSTWSKELFVRVNDISKESNNTNKEISNKLLHQLFFEQCKKTPKNIAVITSKEKLTYEELAIKVNNLASNLKIEKNEIVAVLLDKSIEQVISVLAILSAGGVYLPIDPTYPQERINYLIETCNVKTVIDNDFISNNTTVVNRLDCSTPKYTQSIDDLAYIIFTSGSTGNPKGV